MIKWLIAVKLAAVLGPAIVEALRDGRLDAEELAALGGLVVDLLEPHRP